jgi:hypothetical protein
MVLSRVPPLIAAVSSLPWDDAFNYPYSAGRSCNDFRKQSRIDSRAARLRDLLQG